MITLETIVLIGGIPAEVYLRDGNWENPLAVLTEQGDGWAGDSSVHMCFGDSREVVLLRCLQDWAHLVKHSEYPQFLKDWLAAKSRKEEEAWQREIMW